MISPCPPYYSSALSCLLRSHHVLLFRLVASDCLFVRPSLVALSSLLLSLSLSPCRSHPVFIFCLAILLAFCLLFSAMRQLLSDIEKLGCGCHTRAPKPSSVSCVCRGAEARYTGILLCICSIFVYMQSHTRALRQVMDLFRVTFGLKAGLTLVAPLIGITSRWVWTKMQRSITTVLHNFWRNWNSNLFSVLVGQMALAFWHKGKLHNFTGCLRAKCLVGKRKS